MPTEGFDAITTVWTWPTIPWWLVSASLFGLILLLAALVMLITRNFRPAAGTAIIGVLVLAGGFGLFYAFPGQPSISETIHIIASGNIVEADETVVDGTPTVNLRLDTDPSWLLIVTGDDTAGLAEASGTVKLQCEWSDSATMTCTQEITGAPRPPAAPDGATFEDRTAVPLPAAKE